MRSPGVEAALRLALLLALLPASRLVAAADGAADDPATDPVGDGGDPGAPRRLRPTGLRISGGRLRPPAPGPWRERNAWLAFDEGFRTVRSFIRAIEAEGGPAQPRFGTDLRSLAEGGQGVVLRLASGSALETLADEVADLRRRPNAPRVRLVIGRAPTRANTERLSLAYLGTSWLLGRDASALLPLGPLFGPSPRVGLDQGAALLASSLEAAVPLLAPDGRVVILVDHGGADAVVAAVVGAVAAGFRLAAATIPETPSAIGLVELVPPGAPVVAPARTRANVPLPPVPGGAGDPDLVPARPGIFTAPERVDARPFSPLEAGRAIAERAVAVLQERGEPAGYPLLLGEILAGLDRSGDLRRLVADLESAPLAEGDPDTGRVRRLLDAIRGELERPDHRRLVQVEPGRWWLADRTDREAAQAPLADRLEWAVYGYLSTAGGIAEAAVEERLAGLFDLGERDDAALVRACIASYRSPDGPEDRAVSDETIARRSAEHSEVIGLLADLGHRFGMSVAISPREQERTIRGVPLAARLDERERRALPPVPRAESDDLAAVDCAWYVRTRRAFLFEVEWTAILGELLLRRHPRIPASDDLVRFLVLAPERVELVRAKLARSPLLRDAMARDNWHVLTWESLGAFASRPDPRLEDLEPYLGLDAGSGRDADQLALFAGAPGDVT